MCVYTYILSIHNKKIHLSLFIYFTYHMGKKFLFKRDPIKKSYTRNIAS